MKKALRWLMLLMIPLALTIPMTGCGSDDDDDANWVTFVNNTSKPLVITAATSEGSSDWGGVYLEPFDDETIEADVISWNENYRFKLEDYDEDYDCYRTVVFY